MQYLNTRYYDPELGMFLQPDWWEVTKPGVGTNRYAYSFGDPVNKMDPGGNNAISIGKAVVGLLAAIFGGEVASDATDGNIEGSGPIWKAVSESGMLLGGVLASEGPVIGHNSEKFPEEDTSLDTPPPSPEPPSSGDTETKVVVAAITLDRLTHVFFGGNSGGGHGFGIGKPGKTEFPSDWSLSKVERALVEIGTSGSVVGPAHRSGEVVK